MRQYLIPSTSDFTSLPMQMNLESTTTTVGRSRNQLHNQQPQLNLQMSKHAVCTLCNFVFHADDPQRLLAGFDDQDRLVWVRLCSSKTIRGDGDGSTVGAISYLTPLYSLEHRGERTTKRDVVKYFNPVTNPWNYTSASPPGCKDDRERKTRQPWRSQISNLLLQHLEHALSTFQWATFKTTELYRMFVRESEWKSYWHGPPLVGGYNPQDASGLSASVLVSGQGNGTTQAPLNQDLDGEEDVWEEQPGLHTCRDGTIKSTTVTDASFRTAPSKKRKHSTMTPLTTTLSHSETGSKVAQQGGAANTRLNELDAQLLDMDTAASRLRNLAGEDSLSTTFKGAVNAELVRMELETLLLRRRRKRYIHE